MWGPVRLVGAQFIAPKSGVINHAPTGAPISHLSASSALGGGPAKPNHRFHRRACLPDRQGLRSCACSDTSDVTSSCGADGATGWKIG